MSMLLLVVHFLLQMGQDLRSQGADVGAEFNILFFTPVGFIITLVIINLESSAVLVRRYCLRSLAAYALILSVFIIGIVTNHSLHIGYLLYVMLGIFVFTMVYYIKVHMRETKRWRTYISQNSGGDLVPFERFSMVSSTMMCLTAAVLPVTILSNILTLFIGPLMLITIIFFVQSFISIGFLLTPKNTDTYLEDMDEENNEEDNGDGKEEQTTLTSSTSSMQDFRLQQIEQALAKWCEERRYQDSNVTIFSLAENIGCKKSELTEYFNLSGHTNFRAWLSDIRFNEAVRMMKACPDYSNDAISTECGFSSHTQIYRVFKQKTGLSPNQWRDKMSSSSC